MKIYCCDTECKNKSKDICICTALMDVTECPKRIDSKKKKINKANIINSEISKLINEIPNKEFEDNTVREWIMGNWDIIDGFSDEEKNMVIDSLFTFLKKNDVIFEK
jgi:hypothetical protein